MTEKFRLHLVGLPHTVSNRYFLGCAYTSGVVRLAKALAENDHEVYHYGNPGAEVGKAEHIDVTTDDYVSRIIGDYRNTDHSIPYADTHPKHQDTMTFNLSVASEIRKRIKADDYVLFFYGTYVGNIFEYLTDLQNLPVFFVESKIGYLDSWHAPYKIFESDSVRCWNRSQWNQNWRLHAENNTTDTPFPKYAVHECEPQWNDDTIPTFCDPELFKFVKEKKDYFLYLGRIIPSKGIDLAVKVCQKLNKRLLVAGQGDLQKAIGGVVPDNIDFVGHADAKKRKQLMSNAKGGWVCTYYSEHGGNVVHEYGLSGTPVIATNWGSFTHTVLHKKTGYLIQDEHEAVWAAKNIHLIDPDVCRKWNMNYTTKRMIPKFEAYFERIKNNWYNQDYVPKNLDHREFIHPDDPNYDIDLNPIKH